MALLDFSQSPVGGNDQQDPLKLLAALIASGQLGALGPAPIDQSQVSGETAGLPTPSISIPAGAREGSPQPTMSPLGSTATDPEAVLARRLEPTQPDQSLPTVTTQPKSPAGGTQYGQHGSLVSQLVGAQMPQVAPQQGQSTTLGLTPTQWLQVVGHSLAPLRVGTSSMARHGRGFMPFLPLAIGADAYQQGQLLQKQQEALRNLAAQLPGPDGAAVLAGMTKELPQFMDAQTKAAELVAKQQYQNFVLNKLQQGTSAGGTPRDVSYELGPQGPTYTDKPITTLEGLQAHTIGKQGGDIFSQVNTAKYTNEQVLTAQNQAMQRADELQQRIQGYDAKSGTFIGLPKGDEYKALRTRQIAFALNAQQHANEIARRQGTTPVELYPDLSVSDQTLRGIRTQLEDSLKRKPTLREFQKGLADYFIGQPNMGQGNP